MIGRVIGGRYKIIAPIGEGGMSQVWRAQDLNTGKAVAVKVLREEFREDETFVRRFEREAQAASRMTHPNIANLLDVGVEEDGTRYLVIEFVSGKTLKQFIQESGALRPDTAAQIIIRVLAAVQHAHQNGVIHRDIKPQNILIDKEGTVKVTDFGIARVANAQTMSQDTDVVMGSVYYFSPEQARGAAVDEKSDLYSVGIVLYEMLAGAVPFTGETPVAIAMKHLQDVPIAPSDLNPAVSPALDYVVLHALEKRPRNRYATAGDMLRDVRLALENPETILAAKAEAERKEREARGEQRRRTKAQKRSLWMRRILLSVFAAILLVIIGLASYAVMERVMANRRNTVEVPNFIGMLKADAVNKSIEMGLNPIIRTDTYPLVPENVVADQSVAPGTFVEPGSPVTIIVCESQYTLTIPNVVGLPLDRVVRLLSDMGLGVGENNYVISQAAPDTIVFQSPAFGTPANPGDLVTLTISGGSVTMPQLLGQTQPQAEQTVLAFGMALSEVYLKTVEDPAMVGVVVEQEPRAFVSVKPHSTVRITVGSAASTLFEAKIELDLDDVPEGITVSVFLKEADGSSTQQFAKMYPEGGAGQTLVSLYSRTAREAQYEVYYDEKKHHEGTVMFELKVQ